jgi:hypothetical protein
MTGQFNAASASRGRAVTRRRQGPVQTLAAVTRGVCLRIRIMAQSGYFIAFSWCQWQCSVDNVKGVRGSQLRPNTLANGRTQALGDCV